MEFSEVVGLWIYLLKPLVPYVAIILVLSLIAFVFIAPKCGKIWMNDKGFGYMSLFFNMNIFLAIKLSCAWIKLLLVILFIVGFTSLDVMHFIFLLVPCILMLFINNQMMDIFNHIVNVGIQYIGVIALNILCSYIIQFQFEIIYLAAYLFISILVILYSIYVFILEVDAISLGRRTIINDEKHQIQI